jgi:hypothetical protein
MGQLQRQWTSSVAARLGAFATLLLVALGGGAAIGSTVGPEPSGAPAHDIHEATAAPEHDGGHGSDHEAATGSDPSTVPGVTTSADGYQLRLDRSTIDAGVATELTFVIEAPDGAPLTDYEVAHDKELHLVVVSRDLATYSHLHPERDADGRWHVGLPGLPPGSFRVYTDLVPAGGRNVVLGADLTVPGTHVPRPQVVTTTASVAGYDVTLSGELVPGRTSELALTVTRDGEPVRDLEPYLGALGHLVAIRDGDLAYLHVHPSGDGTDGPGGPVVRFAVETPTAGRYGLYFDFSVAGSVHTASFPVDATRATGGSDAPEPSAGAVPHEHDGGEADHG